MINHAAEAGRDWLDWFQGLLTPTIAGILAWIAWRQFALQGAQHRLDLHRVSMALYDRRLKIYTAVKDLIGSVVRNGAVNEQDVWKFLTETREARFLFNAALNEKIDALYSEALELWAGKERWRDLPVGSERKAVIEEHSQKFKDFLARNKEFEDIFKSYLAVGEYRLHDKKG